MSADGDVDGAAALLKRHRELASHSDSKARPLLREFVDCNNGQMLHDANHGLGTRVKTWLKYGANPNEKNT